MKKIVALSVLLIFVLSVASLAAVKKTTTKTTTTTMVKTTGPASAPAAKKGGFTISPKFSYVGYMGLGVEFAPLYKITDDIDLMGELNWDFWGWSGGSGYVYGELNGVYNLQSIKQGEGGMTIDPYVGGGLIYGFPMGTAWGGGNFTGGIGFGFFGGASTKFDPYTVYGQLKYASAPITWNWNFGGVPMSQSVNALGIGMEFGVRFPL